MQTAQTIQTIQMVAIKSKVDGKIHALPKPARHPNVIKMMVQLGYPTPILGEQGFITSDGVFVNRLEAKVIAKAANQLLPRASKLDQLFSEDVW
jgi:hypothetical protein